MHKKVKNLSEKFKDLQKKKFNTAFHHINYASEAY